MSALAEVVRPRVAPDAGAGSRGVLQRRCGCGMATIAGGECAACGSSRLQRKLAIGAADDPLEAEADRVAQAVVAPATEPVLLALTQRFRDALRPESRFHAGPR